MSASTRHPSRLALVAAGALAAGALALGAGAAAAAASAPSAEGCVSTRFPTEYVCAEVHGTGLYVESIDITRAKLLGGAISDHHVEVAVRSPRGDELIQGSFPSEGTTRGRVRVSTPIDWTFPPDSQICGSFLEGDVLQGTVCFDLRAEPRMGWLQEIGRSASRSR